MRCMELLQLWSTVYDNSIAGFDVQRDEDDLDRDAGLYKYMSAVQQRRNATRFVKSSLRISETQREGLLAFCAVADTNWLAQNHAAAVATAYALSGDEKRAVSVLSTFYDADIVINPGLPDRDIFIFNTVNDMLIETVETTGTLLYGTAVDSGGTVFVAQTDARNTANGRAGTRKEGLAEMENRAFLNQITRVACPTADCAAPQFLDLEPVPPAHPAPGDALATPFGIQVSADDTTVVATAAGSDKLFTMDADSGDVLGAVRVGAVPRGVALVSSADGAPQTAWVLNAVDNSVSRVDVSDPANPTVQSTTTMEDPTHPVVKLGRMAFNDADASTTGTFSCESCHPDGHTDQLIWVLDTPICDVPGCTQIAPRLTMPVRGLRETQPYHWDGIPGDPYGGPNTRSINADEAPTCDIDDPASCTRNLVDGGMASTMCQVGSCPTNDEGLDGALDAEMRDAMATFLLSVPYPPSKTRPFHGELTEEARSGFYQFSFVTNTGDRTTGAQTCGACHRPPFLVSTNTPGTGMDAPTWRGAHDRWMILPQARLNVIDLLNIINMDSSFPEEDMRELGIEKEQPVDLTSHFRGEKRVAPLFLALPYDIPRGSAAAYFPETNVLVPIDSTAEISQTPTSKAIEITISPAQPAG